MAKLLINRTDSFLFTVTYKRPEKSFGLFLSFFSPFQAIAGKS